MEIDEPDGATFKVTSGDWVREVEGGLRPCSDPFFRDFYKVDES